MPSEDGHERDWYINASDDWRMQSSGHSDAQVGRWTDTTAALGLNTGKGAAAQPQAKWPLGGGCQMERPGCQIWGKGRSPHQPWVTVPVLNMHRREGSPPSADTEPAPSHRPGAKIKSRAWRSAAATLGCQRSTMNTARGPSSGGPGGAKREEVGPECPQSWEPGTEMIPRLHSPGAPPAGSP